MSSALRPTVPPFQTTRNDAELFEQWRLWWQRGGTAGNRTAAAFATFANVPENTINKRVPRWKAQAQALALSSEPLSKAAQQGKAEESSLEAPAALRLPSAPKAQEASSTKAPQASRPDLGLGGQSDGEGEGAMLGDDADLGQAALAELRAMLRSKDADIRAKGVALALKQTGKDETGEATPYDGLEAAALLDRLLLLAEPPLRAEWDAGKGKAFLVGSVPRLSKGNTLDADGRLEEGVAE